MKAMVLAAGVGSRLRPLTDRIPKALVEVGGLPMLEHVLRRLEAAGVDDVVVNAHAHAQQVADFLAARRGRARLTVSREDELLLDTGGGLKKAAAFFDDGKTFLVHNVDVISALDLRALGDSQRAGEALATLFVQDRPSKRQLLFSKDGFLLGRAGADAAPPGAKAFSFGGIHAVSPALFPLLTEQGVFSITDAYVRLAREGAKIRAFPSGCYWADIGDAAKLEAARERATRSGLPV